MIKSVHRSPRSFYTKCHFCICTACSESLCPHKDPCYNCKRKNIKKPKLDCDFFVHSFVRFYKMKKTTSAHFTFSVFYKGTKIASGLTYEEMKLRTKGNPDLEVKIDKVAHPYDVW